MSRLFRPPRHGMSPWFVLSVLACSVVALLVGGAVYASSASSQSVIHGCLNTSSHVLRVMNASNRCAAREVPLNWNQQGVPGARGARGKRGIQGFQGAVGATGDTGAVGATGPQGPQGFTGPVGPQGAQGIRGATGAAGPAGITWMGSWSSAASYSVNDAVAFGGSSWIAVQANSYSTPGPGSTVWRMLAQQGATGAVGATGAPGAPGVAGLEYNVGPFVSIPGSSTISTGLGCSVGKRVIGGGFYGSTSSVAASRSYPNTATNVWSFQITNNSATAATVTIYTVCVQTQ